MRMVKGWWILSCALSAFGCSSSGDNDGESFTIASSSLAGKIGGQPWSFVAGQTDAFLSDDEQFWADLYADPLSSACQSTSSSDKHHVILSVPTKPGDYELNLSLNATFVIEGAQTDNLLATRGRLVVDEVTASSIRGKTHIVLDAGNEIDGSFTLTRCPE